MALWRTIIKNILVLMFAYIVVVFVILLLANMDNLSTILLDLIGGL